MRRGAWVIIAIAAVTCALPVSVARGNAHVLASPAQSPIVHFPADQAAHASVPNEWWYVVGHLRSGRRTFGYELTLFKFVNIQPPGFSTPLTIYRTDVAITDESAHRFHHAITYFFPQSVHLDTTSLDERIGSAFLRGSDKKMGLHGSMAQGSFDLTLSSQRRPMLVGGRGYLPFGNGYTYYYSLTDLTSRGTLRVGATTYQVTGLSWLDHQWGRWDWANVTGWTWMALQLRNGVQLSVFDFRGIPNRVQSANVLLDNSAFRYDPSATISATGTWQSPHTQALYPSGWIVRIPSLNATLRVSPTVRDQEMVVPSLPRASYWEGSTRVSGTFRGKHVAGLAYTELTGYARG